MVNRELYVNDEKVPINQEARPSFSSSLSVLQDCKQSGVGCVAGRFVDPNAGLRKQV